MSKSVPFYSRLSLGSVLDQGHEDAGQEKLHEASLVAISVLVTTASTIWGAAYVYFDEPLAGLIALGYALFTTISLAVMRAREQAFEHFRIPQLALILVLPCLLMLSLGGFVNGSVVIVWAFLAPLGALLGRMSRGALYLIGGYLALLVLAAILQPHLRPENNLPAFANTLFFVLNIGTVSLIAFVVLSYFVGQQDLAVELLREKRALETAYVQQEIMLRQSEKLATLGRLSAGLAHELNNPASAAQRSAAQLRDAVNHLETAHLELAAPQFTDAQLKAFQALAELAQQRASETIRMDPITRDDCERSIETWLESREIEDPWRYSPMLTSMNCDSAQLSEMTSAFTKEQFPVAIAGLTSTFAVHRLLDELGQGAGRITEVVTALKNYTSVDRGTRQHVQVHEGLDNTLVILRSKLAKGVSVIREYDEALPGIDAHGGELNQVWTNLIDNAIDAMEGKGQLTLRTFTEEPWLVVEVRDSGPGIPEEIRSKLFEPFTTTKAPGKGTGLGLNISHNIVVQKHKGRIDVESSPEGTCFRVRLPLSRGATEPAQDPEAETKA
jgi:signal transduction histidine kinase